MASKEKQEGEFKHVVRLVTADVDGNKHLLYGLAKVKGVSYMYANAVCRALGLDVTQKVGYLSDETIEKLNDAVKNPAKYGIPGWLFNRRRDLETGEDLHLIGGDLDFAKSQDIKRLRKLKNYRGVRHALGLPVRGQRTKSNFRKNKGRGPGVRRKK